MAGVAWFVAARVQRQVRHVDKLQTTLAIAMASSLIIKAGPIKCSHGVMEYKRVVAIGSLLVVKGDGGPTKRGIRCVLCSPHRIDIGCLQPTSPMSLSNQGNNKQQQWGDDKCGGAYISTMWTECCAE